MKTKILRASPHRSPGSVAKPSKDRCDGVRGPEQCAGVVNTTPSAVEGARPVTAGFAMVAAGGWWAMWAGFAFLLALLPHGLVHALSTDHEQPIHIEADKLEIDETRHISIYTGEVHMRQGSLNLRGQIITMYFDEENNLKHMDIVGDPARFNQLNDDNKPMSGEALEIHYRDNDGVMELRKQASLKSDQDLIESEFIRTNTRTNTLLAGEAQGKGRVRMLIQPRQKTSP